MALLHEGGSKVPRKIRPKCVALWVGGAFKVPHKLTIVFVFSNNIHCIHVVACTSDMSIHHFRVHLGP